MAVLQKIRRGIAIVAAMSAHDEDEEVKAFSCRVENVKTITDILNCLCIDVNKAQPCDVEATPDSKYKQCQSHITSLLYFTFKVFSKLFSPVLYCDW